MSWPDQVKRLAAFMEVSDREEETLLEKMEAQWAKEAEAEQAKEGNAGAHIESAETDEDDYVAQETQKVSLSSRGRLLKEKTFGDAFGRLAEDGGLGD